MTPEEFKGKLSIDSNNVAAKVQMHVHSHTCTKYQRKDMKARLQTQLRENEQRSLAANICDGSGSGTVRHETYGPLRGCQGVNG
jgi:hypothetical protein